MKIIKYENTKQLIEELLKIDAVSFVIKNLNTEDEQIYVYCIPNCIPRLVYKNQYLIIRNDEHLEIEICSEVRMKVLKKRLELFDDFSARLQEN